MPNSRRMLPVQVVVILVFQLLTGIAAAQVGTAALSGEVTDASGGVLPGVTVTLTNTATNVQFTTVTNAEGRYAIPNVPVGNYEVATELQGFDKNVQTGLRLGVGQQAQVNVQLRVGTVSEQLTVTATAVVVDTSNSALGARVSEQQIQSLPLNGRNFDQLSWLAPGVNQVASSGTPGSGGASTPFGRNASFSFAGLRPEGQALLLDGANLQGFWGRGSGSTMAGTSLGIEAVGEYQVLTNTYGAQFGGFGAVVNSVTRSGTNAFHGSAYEFYRNSKFDAPNYFDVGDEPPPFERNQYGLSLGGPIRRSKAFFFVNYEALKQEISSTNIGFVPNAAMRNGFLPCTSLEVVPADCNRANPALVNVGVHPAIAPYFSLYPLPNGPDTGDGRARLTTVHTAPLDNHYVNARLDYAISDADNLMGRYIIDKSDFYAPKGSPVAGFGTFGDGKNQFLTIQERKVFGATLVNTANVHFTRTSQVVVPEATGATVPLLNFMGVGTLPAGAISGAGLAPIGSESLLPINHVQTSIAFADSMSWVRGDHALTFGGEVARVVNIYDMPSNIGGTYTFQNLQQFLTAQPFQFNGVSLVKNNARREYEEIRVEPYAQDDWRVGSSLTLNLGLRWDFMSNPTEVDGLTYTLPDPLTSTALVQVPNVYKKNPTLTNLNPRFGFAWTPFDDEKTAVRGGIGRYNYLLTARSYGLGYARLQTWEQANAARPPFPDGPSALRSTRPIGNQTLEYSDDFHAPYAWTYNVNVQREIYPGAIGSVGYLGSRGEHLLGVRDLNTPVDSGRTPAGQVIRAPGAPARNPAFGLLNYITDDGVSRYHALQLSLTGRTPSMQYLVAYDFSRCHDNGSASYAATVAGTGGQSSYSEGLNPMWDYGRCDFQATHSGKGSLVYLLPWEGNRLVSGWQVSLISQLRSGLPFSPFIGFDIANFGRACGGCRPDLVSGASANPVLGTPEKWFDPTAFTLATIPRGTYGSLPRNTIDGPGLVNFDLSIQKETEVGGAVRVQFRAEVFNLFNRANFGIPNQTVFTTASGVHSPTAGVITNTATSSRQLQFSAKLVF